MTWTTFRHSLHYLQYRQIRTSESVSPCSVYSQNVQVSVQELKISELGSHHYQNLYMSQISFCLKMSFRNIENPLHKQHKSKAKLKCLIYLVEFLYKNISCQLVNFVRMIFRYLENVFFFLCKTFHRQDKDFLNIFSISDL